MNHEIAVHIDAPPERVWTILADVERWPAWTGSMSTVRRVDNGALRVGSRARVKQPKLPAMTWTVTSLEPERSFAWAASSVGVRTEADHTISLDPHGVVVTLVIRQSGPLGAVVGLFMSGLTRRYLEMEAQGLKRQAELTLEDR